MPPREKRRLLLRSFGKLVALVIVAGVAGTVLGVGLSKLLGDDELPAPARTSDPAGTATATTAPAAAPATTTLATTAAATGAVPTGTAPQRAGKDPLDQVDARVVAAILRPAGTPSGQRRRRARLIVRLRAVNGAGESVTVARPVLVVGGARIEADRRAATAQTRLGKLAAGETKSITLRFELAGDATTTVTARRRARLLIADRAHPFRVTIGSPLRPSATAATPPTTTTEFFP